MTKYLLIEIECNDDESCGECFGYDDRVPCCNIFDNYCNGTRISECLTAEDDAKLYMPDDE